VRHIKSITVLACAFAPLFAGGATAPDGFVPTSHYEKREIEGWSVRVNKTLLAPDSIVGRNALRLLEIKLYEIGRIVPESALQDLRKVPIWLGVDDGHAPCAEYHPSRDWLAANGYNPDKARSVEIGNAGRFLGWSRDQPMMILHELAHAYHDQVLSHGHKGIRSAYDDAVASKRYDSVLRADGKRERAYALTNIEEYFAEATEAYFGANDFYPFVRVELKEHDPTLYRVLEEAWRVQRRQGGAETKDGRDVSH
jgi:hypothetical protein